MLRPGDLLFKETVACFLVLGKSVGHGWWTLRFDLAGGCCEVTVRSGRFLMTFVREGAVLRRSS